MKSKNVIWCVFISEIGLSYTIGTPSEETEQQFGFVPIESGTIKKGYIKQPKEIQSILKEIKHKHHLKNELVRIVLGEENLLFKRISIEKELVKSDDLKPYIQSQLGTSIHFPFESPIFDFCITEETEELYQVLIYISDNNLIEDYIDLFESVHSFEIEFDNSYMATYRLFYRYQQTDRGIPATDEDSYIPENTGEMFVSMYHDFLTISIFDGMIPVFTMIEQLEDADMTEMAAHYIERIANYYQYNTHKGTKKINHIEVFEYNLSNKASSMKQGLQKIVTDYKITFFDHSKIKTFQDNLSHKGFFMVHSASFK